ncbi:MAG TPA: hypothetical protein VLT88_06185 [Desulfosarcina sp.]|nr:hypothetical protein [Desulfosarcina sp.]
MFSGVQEILLISAIILGLFFIPRMVKPRTSAGNKTVPTRTAPHLTWKLRLAVVISIIWPVAWALHFRPWQHNAIAFAVVGIGPVVIGWSFKWVLAGMKHKG